MNFREMLSWENLIAMRDGIKKRCKAGSVNNGKGERRRG